MIENLNTEITKLKQILPKMMYGAHPHAINKKLTTYQSLANDMTYVRWVLTIQNIVSTTANDNGGKAIKQYYQAKNTNNSQ